ncbi:MAG: alpha/beta hydrolase [Clostridia bacterium]|nr:alpha/beta hydrolase [Clostridia bacterium]
MKKEKLFICGIPALIWGEKSDRVFIHVHGKMSCKDHAEAFAEIAESYGCQTLSFDLPEHGERTDKEYRCDVWNGIRDLNNVADFAYASWESVSLFACSLGAYFALNTYTDREFDKILFQSPIVDMKWLVEHMMLWSGVTEEMLEREEEIDTPIDLLRWDYYNYIKTHPVTRWHKGTEILYGSLDNLQERESIDDFCSRFNAKLTVSEGSRHPFMEERDFSIVAKWTENCLK